MLLFAHHKWGPVRVHVFTAAVDSSTCWCCCQGNHGSRKCEQVQMMPC